MGVIAGAITSKGKSMGWIANILAGLVGSAVGQALLGSWGPSLAGMALMPSIIGAVIVVAVVSFFLSKMGD
ncbi:GlsB/YeaQ/YmgE family stress response membrane protein [Lactococcus petauri]|uniref:GlsB/YeaQ/YmgE family stress response membrane protein n=1 Tax=Lactococcus petauri TaxID=1940789 RepID=UPI0025506D1B|nr:GlsB/YeaQ/YmgE family stress response membrane protein [Lactococcus petauri]